MGDKILYYGDLNNSKSEELFNKALNSMKMGENEKFIYILPNSSLLTEYRSRFFRELGQTFKINIYTFDDLVGEILDRDFDVIDDEIKDLILYRVIKSMSDDLSLDELKNFESMEGFISSLSSIIGDFKRSLIRSDELMKRRVDIKYFDEIALIYKEYEEYLNRESLFDIEEIYFQAIDSLKKDGLGLEGLDYIVIDSFYDFRPIELYLLEELAGQDLDIYINVPFKLEGIELIEKNLASLEEVGFTIETVDKKMENNFEGLARDIFTSKTDIYDLSKDFKLIRAADSSLEIRAIFEDIKSKIISGTRPEEIAVVIDNKDYLDQFKKLALEESLRISQPYKKNLLEELFVRELLDLLRMGEKETFRQIVLSRLRSSYFNPVLNAPSDQLYAYLKSKNWNSLRELELILEDYFHLEEDPLVLEEFLSIIRLEIEELRSSTKILDYNNFIRDRMDFYSLREGLIDGSKDDIFILKESIDSLKTLEESLEGLDLFSELIGDLEFSNYYRLIIDNFHSSEIELRRGYAEGIQVLNLINLRGIKYKYIYIPAMTQNNYPSMESINFFMKEDNKKELREIGINIRDYRENLDNEMVKFRIALSLAREGVILSYGGDGDSLASVFIDEIVRLSDGSIELEEVNYNYILKDSPDRIFKHSDLEGYILNSLRDGRSDFEKYLGYYNRSHPNRLEKINQALFIDWARQVERPEYIGEISYDDVRKDMESMNDSRLYSSSYLESYAICPYRFLMDRIFSVEDIYEEEGDYDPLKMGNLYHEVLYNYYSYYREDLGQPASFDFESSLVSLDQIFKNKLRELEFDNSRANDLILDKAYSNLVKFIEEDLARLKKDGLRPDEFEKVFGRKKDFYLEDQDGKMYITGIIDRIDKTEDGGLFLMDYKSGSSGVYKIDDIKLGLGIQLPLYVLSQDSDKVLAALYAKVGSASFQQALVKSGASLYSNRIRAGKLDEEEWEEFFQDFKAYILELRRGINSGNFRIEPKECPSYCSYRDICRYDEKVEV